MDKSIKNPCKGCEHADEQPMEFCLELCPVAPPWIGFGYKKPKEE